LRPYIQLFEILRSFVCGKITATLEYRLSTFWQNSFFIKNIVIMPPTRQFGSKKEENFPKKNSRREAAKTIF